MVASNRDSKLLRFVAISVKLGLVEIYGFDFLGVDLASIA
jgi:hypothetical protein